MNALDYWAVQPGPRKSAEFRLGIVSSIVHKKGYAVVSTPMLLATYALRMLSTAKAIKTA